MPTKKILYALLWCGALSASLDVTRTGMSYDLTGAGSAGQLIVASKTALTDGNEPYGIARAVVAPSEITGERELSLYPLVSLTSQVNAAQQNVGTQKEPRFVPLLSANPLYGSAIQQGTVFDNVPGYANVPVVVTGAAADNARTVIMVTDPVAGKSIRMNRYSTGALVPVCDAAGAATTTIRGVAAGSVVVSSRQISRPDTHHAFVAAAVTPSDSADFAGQAAAGIAILYSQPTGLTPVDATGDRGSARAAALTHDTIQIGGVGSIAGVSALHWDQYLQRLYVALQLSSGGVAVVTGQLAMVLVGKEVGIADGKKKVIEQCEANLTLRPVIADADGGNEDANWDGTDYIVAEEDSGITIQKLTTMHTSTQQSYLVVSRNDDKVFALPLVNKITQGADEAALGTLANIADTSLPARNGSDTELYSTSSAQAIVGGGDAPATIQHLYVKGDAVFVSCAGGSVSTQGIFSSTPIFNAAGQIVRWSTWRRVGGAVRDVYGFSIDETAQVTYVSGADAGSRDTVHTATWGPGNGNGLWGGAAGDAGNGMLAAVNGSFETLSGGIHAVRAFAADGLEAGDWYDTTRQLDNSAVVGCMGRNKCAFFMTNQSGTVVTADNYDAATHVGVYDLADDGLDLGMLTSMAIARSTNDGLLNSEGWLFVGGHTGLAVRCKTSGAGWSDLNDLSDITAGEGYRFLELKKADGSSFGHVTFVRADENNLYVADESGLYRIAYDQDKFKDDPDALGEVLIASPSVILDNPAHTFLDMVILKEHAVLATTDGLWTMFDTTLAAVANTAGTGGWRQLTVTPEGTDSFGVCSQLQFVPSASASTGGLLYVLTADVALNVAIVYRVAIPNSDTTVVHTQIGAVDHGGVGTTTRYTTMLGQLREHFYTDGSCAIDAGSWHHPFAGRSPLVRSLPFSSLSGAVDIWRLSGTPALTLTDIDTTVGRPVRDVATGALVVPGTWGIQVLQ